MKETKMILKFKNGPKAGESLSDQDSPPFFGSFFLFHIKATAGHTIS